jgi:hypothetical protein
VTRDGATFPDIEPEIDQLLHPSRFYARPTDVVVDQLLTVDERRAILSSWASDACAVESNPALRQPPHAKAHVTFDEIMDALMQLDRLGPRALDWAQGIAAGFVTIAERGTVVTLPTSKGAQTEGRDHRCTVVRAWAPRATPLERWAAVAGRQPGQPVFRPKGGTIASGRLTDRNSQLACYSLRRPPR